MLRFVFAALPLTALVLVAPGCKRSDSTEPSPTREQPRAPIVEAAKPPAIEPVKAVQPTETKYEAKDPLKAADGDMRRVLEELDALGTQPISRLSVEEARKQKSPADAVLSLLKKEKKDTAPVAMKKVMERKIGANPARVYTPKTDAKGPLPVILYFPGGGWVIADLNTYDASARALAKGAEAIVVAAEYRHAPENRFPAAHEDAIAAYEWTLKNAASLGGDPKRVAVAGESAGGNLALNVAIAARDKNLTMPLHQLLVYPVAQTSMTTRSYQEWANAKPLDKAAMAWFVDKALRSPADRADPRISLVDANLKGLAPTTIILAEIDPLRSDGELLADRLESAGDKVNRKVYNGVTHEFFGMGAYVSEAKDAEEYGANQLSRAFKKD